MLPVLDPLTFVHGSFRIDVASVAMRPIVMKSASILVATAEPKATLALRNAHIPLTLIERGVRPDHLARAVAEVTPPLPCVRRTRLVLIGLSHLNRKFWVILCAFKSLFLLLGLEVFSRLKL